MAPEMFRTGGQTHKVDVWSLFVTMLWTLDTGEFRQKSSRFESAEDAQDAVSFATSTANNVSNIREMAIINLEERASAAQMLVKCFGGVGLSTPQNQIPALTSSPYFTIAAARPLPLAPPPLTTWATRTRQRGLRKNCNLFAAANYRLEKAGHPLQAKQVRQLPESRPKPPAKR